MSDNHVHIANAGVGRRDQYTFVTVVRRTILSKHATFAGDPFVFWQCVGNKFVRILVVVVSRFAFTVVHVDHSPFVTRIREKIERFFKHAEFDDYFPFCIFSKMCQRAGEHLVQRCYGRSRKIGSVDGRFYVVRVASLARLGSSRILVRRNRL